jgi:tetratricopeptide (TPR) repeat protein
MAQYETCVALLEEEIGVEPESETTALYEQIKAGELKKPKKTGRPAIPTQVRLPAFLEEGATPAIDPPLFVARENELNRLFGFLEKAIQGQGQVAFVTGEAGSGKTSLVQEFARQAMEQYADLIVGLGNCNAYTGTGDPLSPFREALHMLSGEVEGHWSSGVIRQDHARRIWKNAPHIIRKIVVHSPDLINAILPAGPLYDRAQGAAVADESWLSKLVAQTERQIMLGEEYEHGFLQSQVTNAFLQSSSEQPLLIILDDLHWIDPASAEQLFHLVRQMTGRPILILGAYRGEEVYTQPGDEPHPIEKPLREFRRIFGDVWLDINPARNETSEAFVEALVDTVPNNLDHSFRAALFEHTRGNPLFTLELLNDFRDRGSLSADETGRWEVTEEIEWERIPARIEGVIEDRISRLEPGARRILDFASVEGEFFTAEVMAHGLALSTQEVIHTLSAMLDRRHQLIRETGTSWADDTKVHLYRFRHLLFQNYLYEKLGEYQKESYHLELGNLLEKFFSGPEDVLGIQMAHHLTIAGEYEKAVPYILKSGDYARRLGASREAQEHFNKGLELAGRIHGVNRNRCIGLFHERLGDVLMVNYADHNAAHTHYQASLEFASDPREQARGERKLAWVYKMQGDLPKAKSYYDLALKRLEENPDQSEVVRIHCGLAALMIAMNKLESAQRHGEIALQTAQRINDSRGQADSSKLLGVVAIERGDLNEACRYDELSLALYEELGDLPRLIQSYNNTGDSYRLLADFDKASELFNAALQLAKQLGNKRDESLTLSSLAEIDLDRGQWEGAIEHLLEALALAEDMEVVERITSISHYLGLAYFWNQDLESAERFLDKGMILSQDTGHDRYIPYLSLSKALVYADRQMFTEARRELESFSEAMGHKSSNYLTGQYQFSSGYLHWRQGDLKKAADYFQISSDTFSKANYLVPAARSHFFLGTVHLETGTDKDKKEALEILMEARKTFELIGAEYYLSKVDEEFKNLQINHKHVTN